MAQIAPRLGGFDENLARHRDAARRGARRRCRTWSCSRSSGLTGYLLQDLAGEVAIRLDDPRLAALAGDTAGLSAIVSFVEESADHRLFIAAALLEDGEIRHVHRKLFLPTYGLFDERRFFAAGRSAAGRRRRGSGSASGSRSARTSGTCRCPSCSPSTAPRSSINVSSSPGRDLAATNEVGLGTATSWRTLMRTYAQLTTRFVVFCNRVGVDESISVLGRLGGHRSRPARRSSARRSTTRACSPSDIDLADVRASRIGLPLLRDERPELQVRELDRIVAERAGLAATAIRRPPSSTWRPQTGRCRSVGAADATDVRPASLTRP